jgi:hypothetical protein
MSKYNSHSLHIYSKVCRMGRSKYTTIPAELARDDDVSVHDRLEWLKTATGYELIVISPARATEAA